MRKEYQKPALYAESFALVEHITSGCGYSILRQTNQWDLNVCCWVVDDNAIFRTGNDDCFTQYDSDVISYTCYQVDVTVAGEVSTVYS